MTIQLDLAQTLGISVIVLVLGMMLVKNVGFLNKFLIPAPVVGGIIFAIITLTGYLTQSFSVVMDDTLRVFFMTCFFATIGFGADLRVLKKGIVAVVIFLFITILLIIVQNVVGIGIATIFDINKLMGLAAGSIPMVGGHGTAASMGPILEQNGLVGGTTYASAAATFGLIAGSLLGGPTARSLIKKFNLSPSKNTDGKYTESLDETEKPLNRKYLLGAFLQIGFSVGLGSVVSQVLLRIFPSLTFPPYIGAMLVAVVMRNVFSEKSIAPTRVAEINGLSEIFLAIFLTQALMDLKLWLLVDLAIPLITILLVQVIVIFIWARFVVFNAMGRDYDAAVMAAGTCGFGLGATPNAMANMNAITQRYGPSPKAFFVIPIVGSLFIDVCNTLLIGVFINFVK